MTNRKIVAVVGATGAQGGGLARAILSDPASGFAVRALTRDVNSEKARELARLGAEVVAADVDDPASIERAFKGVWGAYCVTFFWAHFSAEKERTQGEGMARAAANAGLQHVIWSTFEDVRKWVPLDDNRMPTLMGRYKVPHFDGKAEADRAFLESPVPATCLLTSFYWDNFIYFGLGPRRNKDGVLTLMLPLGNARLPGIAAEDIGKCAFGIFKRAAEFSNKTVGIAGGHLTGEQMAASLGRAIGEQVRYEPVPFDVYRGLGFPGAEDMGNMFQFKHDFEDYYTGARSLEFSRSLNPSLQTFDEWLKENAARIPLG